MFEKIGRYAETVATNAGQSRRGFLERLGQAALGVAGLVGAVLVLPGKVGATFRRVVVDIVARTARSTQPTAKGVASQASSMRA